VDLTINAQPPVAPQPLKIWVVSDGRAGIENQALGLAEAIARKTEADISLKRVAWPRWMRRAPSRITPAWPSLLEVGGDALTPPWPDLWIGNGRASIPLSIGVRRWSNHRTFVVQMQDPVRNPRLFDLVIPPRHDGLEGPNVFPIIGAAHRVVASRLQDEKTAFQAELDALPHPRVAVLIGGVAKAYRMSLSHSDRLANAIEDAIRTSGGSLMLTFSRRTPADARKLLTERLSRLPGVIWNDDGPNPYFAFLGAADVILVTEDSANMPAEAAASGAPVYLLPMEGGQARRRRFHEDLARHGVTRPFTGRLESWTYAPLNETDRAADEVLRRMSQHRLNPRVSDTRLHQIAAIRSLLRRIVG